MDSPSASDELGQSDDVRIEEARPTKGDTISDFLWNTDLLRTMGDRTLGQLDRSDVTSLIHMADSNGKDAPDFNYGFRKDTWDRYSTLYVCVFTSLNEFRARYEEWVMRKNQRPSTPRTDCRGGGDGRGNESTRRDRERDQGYGGRRQRGGPGTQGKRFPKS
ncbi:hypothetical protein GMRT_23236 [Giardia muris]|uniref:Uncharacterized protein n=1 Tax=Giardia muris TaxID=5742 RepID=A0A4Z1SP97_GIAMU|nr:hypothetical protein GMRT_23236 [Giardia muris]|eukprot:TNJ27642.1 hypothetical protein GMRT_23236 [Giardia muris]